MTMPKIFGREPALWISTLSSLLVLFAGFGLPGLNDTLVASLTAFLTAGAAAYIAVRVTPIAPTVFTGVVTTGSVLLASFGLHLTQQQVSLVAAAAAMLVTLVARAQITPINDQRPSRVV